MANASSEYTKRSDGNATVFDVTPAPAPKFWTLVVIGALCALGGLSSLGSSPSFAIVFLAMGGFSLWYGWSRDQRPKPHQTKATFRVTPEKIETNGFSINKDDIHRLLIRNGITDQELNTGVEMSVSTAQAAGLEHRARLATIANALTVESGGKSKILAGGMDKTTAFGLMTDVSKILGFSYREYS